MFTSKLIKLFFPLLFSVTFLCTTAGFAANKPVLNIQHWQTNNGAKVYFVQVKSLPMVDVAVAFHAGSSYDANLPGLASFTNSMLNEGSETLNADQIAEGFDNQGSIYANSVDRDMAVVQLRSLTKPDALNSSIKLFTEVLTQPTFPQKPFLRTQRNTLAAIKAQQQSPQTLAGIAFMKALYGNNPYGHAILGDRESVLKITPQDLKEFYRKYYVAKNAVIAIVGDVDIAKAKQIANQVIGNLPAGQLAQQPKEKVKQESKTVNISYPSNQTYIRIGELGINYHDPYHYALSVGNYTLGGGMVSRLFKTVREQYGYSYGAFSYFLPLQGRGPFIIGLQTKTSQTQDAIKVTREVLAKYLQEGPTAKELKAAKDYIIGSFPLNLDSNSDITSILLKIGFYKLPLNYLDTYREKIKAVTAEQVRQAFQHLVKMNRLVTVTVGKTQNS